MGLLKTSRNFVLDPTQQLRNNVITILADCNLDWADVHFWIIKNKLNLNIPARSVFQKKTEVLAYEGE